MAIGAASGKRQFTLVLHGVGQPHDAVDHVEDWYWCDTDAFERLLDEVQMLNDAGEVVVKLTFDDGNINDLSVAAPALARRAMSAGFFVCTGRMGGKPGYLTAADMAEMEAMGMTIGCHGRDHRRLREVSDATLDAETSGARAALEDALGHAVDAFAIPFGNYDRRVLNAVRPFARVHTTDACCGREGARITNRFCYVRGWSEGELSAIVARRMRLGPTLYHWTRRKAKQLRNRPRGQA